MNTQRNAHSTFIIFSQDLKIRRQGTKVEGTNRWRRGIAVTSLGISTKLLYVGPS